MTTDGFVVPDDYLKIAHGYATTSHSSQGLTANFAVVFGAAFDQKSIYVSHSRARERVDTYIPSKEAFLARAERAQGERLGVLEAIADAKRKNGDGMLNNGFNVGDQVTWNYEARGGYGYVTAVPGVVTKLGSQRVEIAVPSQSKQVRTPVGAITLPDSQWIRVTRWVKPEKLVPRHTRASPEEAARIIEPEPERKTMDKSESHGTDGNRQGASETGSKGDLLGAANAAKQVASANTQKTGGAMPEQKDDNPMARLRGLSLMDLSAAAQAWERQYTEELANEKELAASAIEIRQYLAVPYAEREAAKAAGAKWDWREKLWYIGPEGTREGLAKWMPENAAASAPASASPHEEFAEVLRELGGDLTGEHPIMDGRPHRMATLDDNRGEKSMFYIAHSDGRPAGYAKNNRTGEEQRWKASAVTMTKEQFTAIALGKLAEREADRVALYERTAERLSAHIEAYPALSPDHDYLKAKRISLEPGVFETPRGSMAIPAYDAEGKLWSVQYVNSDGSKRFARESRKEGCFHVVGSTDPVGDLNKAAAIVVAEGYATAATLKSLHSQAGDPPGRVAFVAAFDAGNVPHVARVLRERHLSAAMVIAADNDKAMEGQEPGRNPGLIKGQLAADGAGAVLMAPSFSEEELEAGFSDWNDLASQDEVRAAFVAKELENALVKALERARHRDPALDVDGNTELENASEREDAEPSADQNISSGVTMQNEQEIFFSLGKNGVIEHVRTADGRFVVREGGEKLRILNEDHQGATPEKNTATPQEARVDSGDAEQEPVWELSSGELRKKQTPPAPLERNPQLEWDFRIGKDGAIEHFRTEDGRVAVRESGDKIHILAKDHDAMALALERALERFGGHLHFEGNQARR